MQTDLVERFANTEHGREAEAILRKCVHCGFCTATCPTYQLLGDELDGPRGRIYQIKEILEGSTQLPRLNDIWIDASRGHRSCETTCPSGVDYGRLADIGRKIVEDEVGRSVTEKLIQSIDLCHPDRPLFGILMRFGQLFRPLMPSAIRRKIPQRTSSSSWPQSTHTRKMLVLEACAQPSATPNVCIAARVLDRLGIQLIGAKKAGC